MTSRSNFLRGQRIDPRPITGKETVAELVDNAFLAYNAGRLHEGCRLFAERMLEADVTVGMSLTGAMTPAGLGMSTIIPLMEATGTEEEEAARVLGASGLQMFLRVTLPNIKWGVLYGVILCNARAMGEFGAVYVVSGRITGQTDTMPLRVEKLFQEYNSPAAFAVASVLTLLALVTLVCKVALEKRKL